MTYAALYDPDTDFDIHYTRATGARIAPWLRPRDRILELGCATGAMTASLAGEGRTIVAVDHAEPYLAVARARGLEGVRWVHAELEDELPDIGPADHVVVANVLHELDDPGGLLDAIARRHLAPGGLVHVSLQNPYSLHRLVALEMGLIAELAEVAAAGRRYATRRLYTVADVEALAAGAGLVLRHREGVMLKPLPNDAMAAMDPALLAGLAAASRHLPDHCAMNLMVLGRA